MRVHNKHHFGIDRTLYFARLKEPNVKKEEVVEVVESCDKCRSIDPSPVRWERGSLAVQEDWERLACDITHYGERKFLTVVDCGPSRCAK